MLLTSLLLGAPLLANSGVPAFVPSTFSRFGRTSQRTSVASINGNTWITPKDTDSHKLHVIPETTSKISNAALESIFAKVKYSIDYMKRYKCRLLSDDGAEELKVVLKQPSLWGLPSDDIRLREAVALLDEYDKVKSETPNITYLEKCSGECI